MQLARFKGFVQELSSDHTIQGMVNSLRVYIPFSHKWFDENANGIADDALCARLSRTLQFKSHWRDRNSCHAFFPIGDLSAVVVSTFSVSPSKRTRDRFQKHLETALKHSNDAFNATHDQLTGLLNRAGFDAALKQAAKDVMTTPESATERIQVVTPERALSLLSLDIDFFKQVNDTYGHDYGDLVLRCLARRLESLAQAIKKGQWPGLAAFLARPGGEEFFILLHGAADAEASKPIAEHVRRIVSDEPLPSDAELAGLSHEEVSIPDIRERRITISIGLATISPAKQLSPERAVSHLRLNADTALYCAKSGGRNRCIHFVDILAKYGTVLEHHTETGIVTIDIGRRVGVALNQEFFVYHPDFTGDKDFIRTDARTQKKLGTYPRRRGGRIVVFDVQEDIAFCHVVHNEGQGPFPVGSALEAIPVGSITHLIREGRGIEVFHERDLLEAEELRQSLKDTQNPFVGVFALNDVSSLIDKKGVAFINECLANLYKALRKAFTLQAKIGAVGKTELAVILGGTPENNAVDQSTTALGNASEQCKRLATFSAGLYVSNRSPSEQLEGDASELIDEHSLDYAAYAGSLAQSQPGSIQVFTPVTAREIIFRSRKAGNYARAIQDYKAFCDLGVRYGQLDNQGALCAFEGDPWDAEMAIAAIRRAVELDPTEAVLRANLAIITFAFIDRLEAYDVFTKAFTVEPEFELTRPYFPAFALSLLAFYHTDPTKVEPQKVHEWLQAASDVELVGALRGRGIEAEIAQALEEFGASASAIT